MSGRGRGRGRPLLMCINCNICVNTLHRYLALELDTRTVTILCSWVYPRIITEDDVVCESCKDLAMFRENEVVVANDDQQAPPRQQGHTNVCLLCGRSTLQRQSDRILRDNPTELQQSMINIIESRVAPQQLTASDRVCHACWLQTQRHARRLNLQDEARYVIDEEPLLSINQPSLSNQSNRTANVLQDEDNVAPNPQNRSTNVHLPDYRRASNSNSHCIFPNCNSSTLHGITDKLRAIVLSNHKYYLPALARVCNAHLTSNSWHTLYDSQNSHDTFTPQQIQHVFSFVNAFNPSLDFENIQEMDERVLEYWLGLSKAQFNVLLEEVPRLSEVRRGPLGLATLLLKMRTGDSDERISTLVNVPRRTLEGIMKKVREILVEDFVPANLGISHLPRQELLEHNLSVPNGLFGDAAKVICDGTYLYIHKSSNYMFQKQSYSLHKYRNLLKPFMIVACDGYIVDCLGPYKATTSDADIMTLIFRESSDFRNYFRENDVFILDRGFRDSISYLEGCGYKPYMPESLLPGEHQLTTGQANRSRCVTICRWVVEAVNGHIKRDFKLFRQEYFHRALPHMMDNLRIAAALLNKFGVRFVDNIYASEIIEIIRERMNLVNHLSNMVDAINMNRRTSFFENITADPNNLSFFPTLEYRDLILFALGTYQIRQARSYYGEHIRANGGYTIEVCSEQFDASTLNVRGITTLIRGKIKSRHISAKKYYVYILVENNVPGRTGILEYCCNCLVGRRTVGCCAHVMTLVWYLGWARHQENISAPAAFLDGIIIREDDEE